MILSQEQQEAIQAIHETGLLAILGYAGTGKTTVTKHIIDSFTKAKADADIEAAAFTGNASKVIKDHLGDVQVGFVGTIHRLLECKITKNYKIVFTRENFDECDLLIIDEISMVPSDLLNEIFDRLDNRKTKVLVLGDPGQLPPIFDDSSADLIVRLNSYGFTIKRLTQVYRQRGDNPLLDLATDLRETKQLSLDSYKITTRVYETIEDAMHIYGSEEWTKLTGFNKVVQRINQKCKRNNNPNNPYEGERILITKNNYQGDIIFNGEIYECVRAKFLGMVSSFNKQDEQQWQLTFKTDEGREFNKVLIESQFQLGYGLTVHKSQGTQADKVVLLIPQNWLFNNFISKEWLYTGVTRAINELHIVVYHR